jgi:tetratricopeptide (TPR) repeat protein
MNEIRTHLIASIILLMIAWSGHAQTARELASQAYDTPSHQEAIQLYDKAIEIDPQMKYAFTGRGLRRQELGDIDGAITDFTKALEIDPLFSDAYGWRAEARQLKGDMEGARKDNEAAEEARTKGDHVLREYEQRLSEALGEAKTYLSRAQYKKRKGDYAGAIEDFDKYLQIVGRPNNEMVFLWRANAKKALGDVEGALDDYSVALRMFPRSEGIYAKRAALRKESGDVEGSEADLVEVTNIQREGKLKQIEKLSRAIENAEDPSYLQLQRSELWMEVGDSTNALRDARQVLNVSPNDPRAKRLEKKALRSVKEHQQPKKEQ